jgi:hypothetical protein
VELLTDTKSLWLIGVSFVHMVAVLAVANFFITLMRNKGALNFFSTVFSLAVADGRGEKPPATLSPATRLLGERKLIFAVLFNDLECIAVVIGESTDVFIGRRIIDEYDERILAFRDRLFYEEYRLRAGQSSCVNCFHASFSLSLERVLHACC